MNKILEQIKKWLNKPMIITDLSSISIEDIEDLENSLSYTSCGSVKLIQSSLGIMIRHLPDEDDQWKEIEMPITLIKYNGHYFTEV